MKPGEVHIIHVLKRRNGAPLEEMPIADFPAEADCQSLARAWHLWDMKAARDGDL